MATKTTQSRRPKRAAASDDAAAVALSKLTERAVMKTEKERGQQRRIGRRDAQPRRAEGHVHQRIDPYCKEMGIEGASGLHKQELILRSWRPRPKRAD